MPVCSVCRSPHLDRVLDLGPQPVSSHLTERPDAPFVQHELRLAVCGHCGLVQLETPFPFRDLTPPYDWITYREPEAHLDAVVDQVWALPGLGSESRAAGLSFKDASTLERLRRRGMRSVWPVDLVNDLGATDRRANIESVQGLLTPEVAQRLAGERGTVDVLFARHVVEHAEAPHAFLEALGSLLSPEGYLVIEVPDCRDNLKRQDYTMIWEEHALYFTPETLPPLLSAAGCAFVGTTLHEFAFENVLVMIGRKTGLAGESTADPAAIARNVKLAEAFGAAFPQWTERYSEILNRWVADGRRAAAYGAGHLTCAFLHFHGFAEKFAFVVDDTPQKQGLFLPKSGITVVARDKLDAKEIAACLFGLSPDVEDKVIANNARYLEGGGEFHSMFADSRRSIRKLLSQA